jgi:hypothetical protein
MLKYPADIPCRLRYRPSPAVIVSRFPPGPSAVSARRLLSGINPFGANDASRNPYVRTFQTSRTVLVVVQTIVSCLIIL